MTATLPLAALTKFDLLADGITLTEVALAHVVGAVGDRPLTPADYASTSGVILELDGEVWVNAPIAAHNPNFVGTGGAQLDLSGEGLVVRTLRGEVPARLWVSPDYHGQIGEDGQSYNSYAFTHADRVRVSPVEGCAYTCTFCDLPYEFRYRTKSVEGIVAAARAALTDATQPARHILISGGTPREDDHGYVRDVYDAVLTSFPDVSVDIMMVPLTEVLDVEHLAGLGLNEVSINLEVWDDGIARRLMPRKHKQGREFYLERLRHAADVLGGDRVRSMFMLGLEPLESTLAGVEAVAALGCVPVLSPFRPDPSTPLRHHPVPTSQFLTEAYLRAGEIVAGYGVPLGPPCIPCAHNTLTLPESSPFGAARSRFGEPLTV